MPKAKKPVLTPEQKAALKAEKKRLKLLAAAEKKKQIIRDYLSRELTYGLENTKKLEEKFKPILQNLKLQDLGIEFELAVTNAERLLDLKNYIISILMDELDVANKQYDMNFGAHCEKIDEIYQSFLRQLQDMKEKYETGILFIRNKLNEEINGLNVRAVTEQDYLNELQFGNETITKNEDYEVMVSRLKYVEEMKQKYVGDHYCSEDRFQKRFLHFWNSYKNVVQTHYNENNEKKKEYDEFQKHNKQCTIMIKNNREKLFHQYVYMKKEKDRQEVESEMFQQKIEYHTDELHRFKYLLDGIKKVLERDEITDKIQLKNLTKYAGVTSKKLQEKINIVERVLKMYTIVRKYETEKEKILPFPKMAPDHLPKGFRVLSNRSIIEGFSLDNKEFVYFWQRVAESDKLRNYLDEEMEVLVTENKRLRKSILSCLSADPDRVFSIAGIDMKMICK